MRRAGERSILRGRKSEAQDMPTPPGHREIQEEEFARLFGRMVGARLVALPVLLALALWLAFVEPTPWRRGAIALCVGALCLFFVVEFVAWRRRGFTAASIPRNLAVAVVGQTILTAVTGGLASPFVYLALPLAAIVGVFFPFPASLAAPAFQTAAVLVLALAGATGAVPDLNPDLFGGGPRPSTSAHLWTHAAVLSVAVFFSNGVAAAIRSGFERTIRRALGAQQESLELHAQRAEELTAMSAEIAHELKNPLASVKGLGGLLAAQVADGKGAERLQVLRREVDRMQAILDEFLNFSRPLVPLALGEVDLGALCREVTALHEGMAREREVDLAVRPGAAEARCDPRKVKQILVNLVQNALDATPRGGEVVVEAAGGAGKAARVRVLDRGRGVDPAIAGELFSPGATTKPAGSGLGLTIARALARQHGGELTLSPRPGGGTVAELELPAAPHRAGGGRAA
jgi:signal transduction histidine kinase